LCFGHFKVHVLRIAQGLKEVLNLLEKQATCAAWCEARRRQIQESLDGHLKDAEDAIFCSSAEQMIG
jgi:hypothetical protein